MMRRIHTSFQASKKKPRGITNDIQCENTSRSGIWVYKIWNHTVSQLDARRAQSVVSLLVLRYFNALKVDMVP